MSIKKTHYNEKKKESPRGIGPCRFPPPLGVQNTVRSLSSRYGPKWCKFLKLVIHLTFDVLAAPPPDTHLFSAPFSLHTATAPAVRAAVKTVVSCRCFAKMHDVLGSRFRLRFRLLQLKTPVFCCL